MKYRDRVITQDATKRRPYPKVSAIVELAPNPPVLFPRVKNIDLVPGIIGLCVGYEQGQWRSKQLVEHMFDELPGFALKYSESEERTARDAIRVARAITKAIYKTDKFKNRGEFGELLLHIAIQQEFGTLPAISKIYYKDADNDTIKGFDAVHIVFDEDRLELWLGESKLYSNIAQATTDVVAELQRHTDADYLRREFAAITNKIDDKWRHAVRLRRLLHPNTSLDDVFDSICLPVLLTYDSAVVNNHKKVTEQYNEDFAKEIRRYYEAFASKKLPRLRIQLFLVPLQSKEALVAALDQQLKAWQNI